MITFQTSSARKDKSRALCALSLKRVGRVLYQFSSTTEKSHSAGLEDTRSKIEAAAKPFPFWVDKISAPRNTCMEPILAWTKRRMRWLPRAWSSTIRTAKTPRPHTATPPPAALATPETSFYNHLPAEPACTCPIQGYLAHKKQPPPPRTTTGPHV